MQRAWRGRPFLGSLKQAFGDQLEGGAEEGTRERAAPLRSLSHQYERAHATNWSIATRNSPCVLEYLRRRNYLR